MDWRYRARRKPRLFLGRAIRFERAEGWPVASALVATRTRETQTAPAVAELTDFAQWTIGMSRKRRRVTPPAEASDVTRTMFSGEH